jgi:hypothetical protein
MQAEGIYTYQGYAPLYRERLFITNEGEYPWLKGYNYLELKLPETERLADEESIWLRQNHLLGNVDDIMDVANAFSKVTEEMRKNPDPFLTYNT